MADGVVDFLVQLRALKEDFEHMYSDPASELRKACRIFNAHHTEHEAEPPLGGIKYATNLWLHQHDFRSPHTKGCNLDATVHRRRDSNWRSDAFDPRTEVDDAESAGLRHEL